MLIENVKRNEYFLADGKVLRGLNAADRAAEATTRAQCCACGNYHNVKMKPSMNGTASQTNQGPLSHAERIFVLLNGYLDHGHR